MVQQAVEHGGGGGVVGQEPAPGVGGQVAGDAEGASVVGGGDEREQELGAGEVEGREAELVDDHEVGAEEVVDDLRDAVVGEAAVEVFDEVSGSEVADLESFGDRGVAEGEEEEALAGAG